MGLDPQIADRKQALTGRPPVGHPGLDGERLGQTPVAFATDRRQDRLPFARCQLQQMPDLGACVAPLFPAAHPDVPSDRMIQDWNGPVVLRDAKGFHPASKVPGVRHVVLTRPGELPPLTILVVREKPGMPGVGFIAAQDIRRAQQEVFKYEWLAHGGPTPEDFERAVRERPSNGTIQVPVGSPRLPAAPLERRSVRQAFAIQFH
jgi:hypothetical protein